MLLSKGLLYQLQAALVSEFDFTIPVNLMATSRVAAGAESSRVVVSYSQVDAGGSSLVIADTVASGSTVLAALEEYRRSNVVDSLMVLSFAGSAVGARKIDRYCQAEGIECKFVYGLAAFGLAPNGFDLSFLHPDTVTSARYVERASALFGGVPVSAVGWDFGSQAMAPEKYGALCWLEAEYWGMHGHPEFRLERRPEDFRIVEKEHSAFDR
ncbi:hypothetical protein [Propionicicella superfundia]|uniref:hypothetical protein n=1 Tax=Propionicicella superfundia TaxID=348582 RepID=UPI00048E38CF|nr:hypothetical protein [Propionicicella superfundia]